jgi:hypothetical protein
MLEMKIRDHGKEHKVNGPVGVREWVIAEGYIPSESHGPEPEMTSHERLTMGALSLMGDEFWRQGFGPLLNDCKELPFGDIEALKSALAAGQYAALVLEPMQDQQRQSHHRRALRSSVRAMGHERPKHLRSPG